MPRDGSGIYQPPAGSNTVTAGTTILSALHNSLVNDLVSDANAARPITAGGTGATSASAARTALGLAIGSDVQAYDADTTKNDVANTFTAAQTIATSSASPLTVSRTGSAVNASIAYTNTAGTVYAGNSDGTSFAVDGDNNIGASPWLLVTSSSSTAPIWRANNGTAGFPTFSFTNDVDSGVFLSSDGVLGLSAAGTARATVSATALTSTVPVLVPDGTVSAPSIAPASDTDTGFYAPSAGTIAFTENGTQRVHLNSAGFTAGALGSTFGVDQHVSAGFLGTLQATKSASSAINASRTTSDGRVINVYRGTTLVGGASVTAAATSWDTSSDGRLKPKNSRVSLEQEIDIDAVWDAIQPLAYTMLDGSTLEPVDGRYYGMIAQKLYKVFPQAVTKGKGTPGKKGFEPWSIDYSKLVPLMIARQKQFERRTNERLDAAGL